MIFDIELSTILLQSSIAKSTNIAVYCQAMLIYKDEQIST